MLPTIELTQAQILAALPAGNVEKDFVRVTFAGADITIQKVRLKRALRATAKHPNRRIVLEHTRNAGRASLSIMWGAKMLGGRLRIGRLVFADQDPFSFRLSAPERKAIPMVAFGGPTLVAQAA